MCPTLALLAPLLSTLRMSELDPVTVTVPATPETTPPVVGAMLPTLTVLAPLPVLIASEELVVRTLTVSMPVPVERLVEVPDAVLATVKVSALVPVLIARLARWL